MNLVTTIIIILLFAYFLISGVRHFQLSKTATDTSVPTKDEATAYAVINITLALLILLVAIQTFRKYGDIDYSFATIHRFLH